jgi:hypothetical protein
MVLFQPLLAPGDELMGGKLAEFELVRGRDDIGAIKSDGSSSSPRAGFCRGPRVSFQRRNAAPARLSEAPFDGLF